MVRRYIHAVSIRAPIRRPGRLLSPHNCVEFAGFNPRPDPKTGATRVTACPQSPRDVFQSAPRSEDRGDFRGLGSHGVNTSFNPRPDPKTGATVHKRYLDYENILFQSAPRSEDRGDKGICLFPCAGGVSIRAPIRRPGRRPAELRHADQLSVSIRAPIRRPGRPLLRLGFVS